MALHSVEPATIWQVIAIARCDEVWLNGTYQVSLRRVLNDAGDPMCHLSIKRRDKAPCRDWRDFQQIKNELCGPECEGVELYPAESRLVDTANQYHLWVYPAGRAFPFGFEGRMMDADIPFIIPGAVQRPRA